MYDTEPCRGRICENHRTFKVGYAMDMNMDTNMYTDMDTCICIDAYVHESRKNEYVFMRRQ